MQFVKGLRTLYDAGARVFVEVGPKKALQGFAERCPRRTAAMWFRCLPIIRSSAISYHSTRRCAAFMQRA